MGDNGDGRFAKPHRDMLRGPRTTFPAPRAGFGPQNSAWPTDDPSLRRPVARLELLQTAAAAVMPRCQPDYPDVGRRALFHHHSKAEDARAGGTAIRC